MCHDHKLKQKLRAYKNVRSETPLLQWITINFFKCYFEMFIIPSFKWSSMSSKLFLKMRLDVLTVTVRLSTFLCTKSYFIHLTSLLSVLACSSIKVSFSLMRQRKAMSACCTGLPSCKISISREDTQTFRFIFCKTGLRSINYNFILFSVNIIHF